jgi:ABC-type glycerol-3-phosphate transport system substrate-binding protein
LKKLHLLTASALAFVLLVSGCAKNGGSDPEAKPQDKPSDAKNKEPVELTFYLYSMSDGDFKKYYEEPLKEKFPYITAKGIVPQKGQFISELVAAGTIPDIIIGSKKAIEDTVLKYEMTTDISELIKKNNYDMGKLNPALIDAMKTQAGGKIIGLPFDETRNVLYYNKDLFDKFGVPYPKDGMTWDDVYEIAKKMTRSEGGVQYRGYSERYHDILLYQNPYGISPIDRKEEKGSLGDERWKKVIDNMMRFYTLPGLTFDSKTATSEEDRNVFVKGLSAMQIFPQAASQWQFNWDVVSLPAYKDAPNIGTPVSARYNFITQTSKNKEAAFDAISYLTNEERQLQSAKDGSVPAFKMNDRLMKSFKENDPYFKGKNIGAFFKYPRAPGAVQNVENRGNGFLAAQVAEIIAGKKDMNTALRDADDAIAKDLAAEKAKQK